MGKIDITKERERYTYLKMQREVLFVFQLPVRSVMDFTSNRSK